MFKRLHGHRPAGGLRPAQEALDTPLHSCPGKFQAGGSGSLQDFDWVEDPKLPWGEKALFSLQHQRESECGWLVMAVLWERVFLR